MLIELTWEETSNSIKVNKSRYKQCGSTHTFKPIKIILRKDDELLIQKTQY